MAKEFEDASGLLVECLHRTKNRCLLVECLTCPGDKGGRDAQRRAIRVFQDVSRAGNVPGGVAARFEGLANAPGWEAGGVRLALDQLGAGEFGHRAPVAVGRQKAVVLFSRAACERVEDVCIVRGTLFDRPILHG